MKDNRTREQMMKVVRDALVDTDSSDISEAPCAAKKTFIDDEGEDISVLFAQSFTQFGGKMYYCYNEEDISKRIIEIQQSHGDTTIGCASENLVSFLGHLNIENRCLCDISKCYTLGATLCETLIAWRGGIVISSNQGLGTTIPSLPETTIVLAFTSQVVTDWEAAFERMKSLYNEIPENIMLTTPASYAYRKGLQKLYLILIEDETN